MFRAIATEVGRRHFFTSLGVWLGLQILCWVGLNMVAVDLDRAELKFLFYLSLPLGLLGAALVGLGSGLAEAIRTHMTGFLRWVNIILADLLSFLGLAGISFPLFVMGLGIVTTLLNALV